MTPVTLARPSTWAPSPMSQGSAIRFWTGNSEYLFTWIQGQRTGVMVCLGGTFAGDVVSLPVEPFRDLAWVGQRIDIPGMFTSTVIRKVDRGAAS